MGVRRQAREAALQMLYLCDNCKFPSQEAGREYFQTLLLQSAGTAFAHQLFSGTVEKIDALDKLIMKYAENWALDRMATVDRNILRLAAYELVEMPETPVNVIIDEAVEIAKKYSTLDSGKFVNGILDKLKNSRKLIEIKPAEKNADEKYKTETAG